MTLEKKIVVHWQVDCESKLDAQRKLVSQDAKPKSPQAEKFDYQGILEGDLN